MKEDLIKIIKSPEIFRKGKFTLRDKTPSNFYIRIKKAYGIPGFLLEASKEIHEIIPKETTCVAGMGIGGIPLVSVYEALYGIPACFVRNEQKPHGTNNQIEGYPPTKKDSIVMLDDVYTTGSSLKDTYKILETTEAKIIQACVILARNEPNLNFPTKSVLTMKDIL